MKSELGTRRLSRSRWRVGIVVLAATSLVAARASAANGDAEAQKGLNLAKRGDCPKAIPHLEEAELQKHRPSTASALADCYLSTGDLLRASDLYHAIADDSPSKGWTRADVAAQKGAQDKADAVDKRIPTLKFDVAEKYPELDIEVNGKARKNPSEAKKYAPDEKLRVLVTAKGYEPLDMRVVLQEGEKKTVKIVLEKSEKTPPKPGAGDDDKSEDKDKDKPKNPRPNTLGLKYRGYILPQFVMNAFVDGGTNLVLPGATLSYTVHPSDFDLVLNLGYVDYRMPEVAIKGKGTPDTEWEYVESTLHGLLLSADLLFNVPLDKDGDILFRVGAGLGVGWTFAGDIFRTQSYPKNLKAGDPNTYLKCKGPNNPVGTFRYCNSLDKDADHYPGYVEPSWFSGGSRPLIYPWAALPELDLSWRVSKSAFLDFEGGLSVTGFLTGAGFRIAL